MADAGPSSGPSSGSNRRRLLTLNSVLQRSRDRTQPSKKKYAAFTKEVCLLTSKDMRTVPVQTARLALHQQGHIVQGVDIRKDFLEDELNAYLLDLFRGMVPEGCTVAIKISIGKFLVQPNLRTGEKLTSLNLQKIMKGSKTIYLAPSKDLDSKETVTISSDSESLPGDIGDDSELEDYSGINSVTPESNEREAPSGMNTVTPESNEREAPSASVDAVVTGDESGAISESEEDSLVAAIEAALKAAGAVEGVSVALILEAFSKRLVKGRPDGRPLDIKDQSLYLGGSVFPIGVDRADLLKTAFYEILAADQRDFDNLDIRIPLEVSFYGEACSIALWFLFTLEACDLGGPRRHFYTLVLREIYQTMMTDGKLVYNEYYVRNSFYYAAGILISLSLYQGGPPMVLTEWYGDGPHYDQFRGGLKRTGLDRLMEIPVINKVMTTTKKAVNSVHSWIKLFQVEYSEASSNDYIAEKEMMKLFVKYCRDVYRGDRSYGGTKVTLKKMLCFVTGCEEEPPLGFSTQPYISFKQTEDLAAPTANTCTNHLVLPCPKGIKERTYDSEPLYKLLDMGFISEYFGLV